MTYTKSGHASRPIRQALMIGIVALTFTWLGMMMAGLGNQTERGLADSAPDFNPAVSPPAAIVVNGDSPFKAVARQITPAVVFITNTHEMVSPHGMEFFHSNPLWERFFGEEDSPQTPRKQEVTSSGSGIIINAEGYILTNNHVVEGATKLRVILSDDDEYDAEVVGSDSETDLAVLRLLDHEGDLPFATLGNSDLMEPGDWAIAIGNPFGLERTVTVGVISATGRSGLNIGGRGGPSFQNFLQTDASINFGNSGGPLVNIKGEVIGINTAINAAAQGIGFAIPSNMASRIYQQLKQNGEIVRGYLGMVPRALDPAIREALELSKEVKGIFVDNVEPDTPASAGKLQSGDIITHWNGQPVELVPDFRFRVAAGQPGEKVTATILRNGKEKRLRFELGNRSNNLTRSSAAPAIQEQESVNFLGIEARDLTDKDRSETSGRVEQGVIITGFKGDSPAIGVLAPGDIIIAVGNETVQNLSAFNDTIDSLQDDKSVILLRVFRNNRFTYVTLKL
jgi:serine protease Do